jgi:hypothetical protein
MAMVRPAPVLKNNKLAEKVRQQTRQTIRRGSFCFAAYLQLVKADFIKSGSGRQLGVFHDLMRLGLTTTTILRLKKHKNRDSDVATPFSASVTKNRLKCSPDHFFVKLTHNFNRGK